MDKNKYYIPELEEFHYGFEFEMIPSIGLAFLNFSDEKDLGKIIWATEFRKEVFGQPSSISMFGTGFPGIEAGIKAEKCRVKYLDRADIQELGFRKLNALQFITEAPGDLGFWTYVVIDYRGSDYDTIVYGQRGSERGVLFRGHIRNKCELIKILKRIHCYGK